MHVSPYIWGVVAGNSQPGGKASLWYRGRTVVLPLVEPVAAGRPGGGGKVEAISADGRVAVGETFAAGGAILTIWHC